jgi:hypothetical protein
MRKKPSPFLFILLLALFIGSLTGCGAITQEEAEAEAFVNRYFKYLKNQDFHAVKAMYSDSAFGVVSSSKALRGIKKTMKGFGPVQKYEYDKESTYVKDSNKSRYSLKLSYEVVYRNMKTREGFTITRKKGKWLIMSHTITRL